MKHLAGIILMLILFSGFQTEAQTLDVEWGGSTKLDTETKYLKLAGSDRDKYYLVRVQKGIPLENSKVWIESVSRITNGIEMSYELTMPEVYNKPTSFENLFYLENKLILLAAQIDGVKQRKTVYAFIIEEDGSPVSHPLLLGNIPYTGLEKGFQYMVSDDKKYITVFYTNEFTVYSGEPLVFKVIDTNLEIIDQQNIELTDLIKRKFNIEKVDRGPSGNFYLAIAAEPETRRRSRARAGVPVKINYEYTFYVWNSAKKQLQPYPIEVDRLNPSSITFEIDAEENILLFGQTTKRSAPAIVGFYYQKLVPRFEKFTAKTVKDFSRERDFMNEFKNEKNGPTAAEWYSYSPGQVTFLDNGSVIYLTEQHYQSSRTMVEPRTKKETVINYDNHGDIIALEITDNDEPGWMTKIPKNQFSTDDFGYYASFYVTTDMNKTKIFFNDNSRNFGKVSYEKTKDIKFFERSNPGGTAALITIYPDGNIDKVEMFRKEYKNVNIQRDLIFHDNGHYFFFGQDGSDIKFGNFFFE